MKSLVILFVFFSTISMAQSFDETEAQLFWESNIKAILESDIDKVVEQTKLPLNTFDGEWDEEAFRSGFEIIFDETVLEELGNQSINNIQPVEYEPGEMTYMIVLVTITEVEGDEFESATILSFTKVEDDWKLVHIDMVG